ncbi:MAG: class I SAM-dependent methyltransferase, partial [Planctomycetota bacterium]
RPEPGLGRSPPPKRTLRTGFGSLAAAAILLGMGAARGELPVERRWQRAGDGGAYRDARFRTRRARERDPRLVRRVLGSLPSDAPPIESILDVPCGAGRLREAALAATGRSGDAPRWTGVDVSDEMLRAVSKSTGGLVRASADALPFADGAFDLVLCCRLLHHLADAEARTAVIAELVRVARRYVVASHWDAASFQAWRHRTQGPLRRRKRGDTRRAIGWRELSAEFESQGARPIRRAHSLRFVSQQAFLLAETGLD